MPHGRQSPVWHSKELKMGFGTLFIGYFLLLNLTYYGFTDVIAAAVMMLGLYKLSPVNKYFRYAFISAVAFLGFSFGEFGIAVYEIFIKQIGSPILVSVMSVIRCICVGALTVLILKGVEEVAKEVEIKDLSVKAARLAMLTAIIYALWITLEAPIPFIKDVILGMISLIVLLATIALIIVNLSVIYSCYMKICMPGEEVLTDKPSKFAFVNEYRARRAERDKEEQLRRIERLKAKREKRKGKK